MTIIPIKHLGGPNPPPSIGAVVQREPWEIALAAMEESGELERLRQRRSEAMHRALARAGYRGLGRPYDWSRDGL